MSRVKRIGLGTVDMGVSSNPSFQRGMLKNISRTLFAEKCKMSAVCKVVISEADNRIGRYRADRAEEP